MKLFMPSGYEKESIASALAKRVLTLDGSMGVMLLRLGLTDKGNLDILCLSRPDIVESIHMSYLEAGADIIETNTFNANRLSQAQYGCEALVSEINRAGAAIAVNAARAFEKSHPGRRCFVAGAMGPTAVSASLTTDANNPASSRILFENLTDAYAEQAASLIEGGVDALLIETVYDILNAKAAVAGVMKARSEKGADTPFIISATVSGSTGRLFSGHTICDLVAAVAPYVPLAVGLNCSDGPDNLTEWIRDLSGKSPFPVIFYPNAGLPDENGEYAETPDSFASKISGLLNERCLNIVGGCCGTSPQHIAKISELASSAKPRGIRKRKIVFFTGAGMSKESGLPTFRGEGGIWNELDVEKVASIRSWHATVRRDRDARRQAMLDFFNPLRRAIISHEPNEGHRIIAALENEFDVEVITQNGDDFHSRAGSSDVIYLHGEALKNASSANPYISYPIDLDNPDIHLGDKAPDGSQLRPFVIYFGEKIDMRLWQRAVMATKQADFFVVVGSSMLVFPAADLIKKAKADCRIFIIDPAEVEMPQGCRLPFEHIRAGASDGLALLAQILRNDTADH